MTGLIEHLATGETSVCRAWRVTRKDGTSLGFTDHDLDLEIDGLIYRAGSGLDAKAVLQTTGLSVDNTEAMGALNDDAIREEDIAAGRYDGAEVVAYLVNWTNTDDRMIRFRGQMGELRRGGGAFHAELRGLTELLNHPIGRVYQRPCGAVLGDTACGVDLTDPAFVVEGEVQEADDDQHFAVLIPGTFADRWFDRGTLTVLSGPCEGLSGLIKEDRTEEALRRLTLWQPLGQSLGEGITLGATVKLVAGCDKRAETCRVKFDNMLNFRGFPDIPGEDWLIRAPRPAGSS